VSWLTPSIDALQMSFPDDPSFNGSDDSNRNHQLNTLYFYSPGTQPVALQCKNSAGNWVNVQSSSGDSYQSVINTKDGFGNPQNINYNALEFPVYQHRWPGALLVNNTNCKALTTTMYAPVTNAYTYHHMQYSYEVRALNADGGVVSLLPLNADSCRQNNGALNLWQRTAECANPAAQSMVIAAKEQITREWNFANMIFVFNTHRPSFVGASNDQYDCNMNITLDGISQGSVNVSGTTTTWAPTLSITLRRGNHTLGITAWGCLAYADAYPRCTTGGCTANTIYGVQPDWSPSFPRFKFGVNVAAPASVEQQFPFTIP